MAAVEYENVSKRFSADSVALRGLSLEIKDTEFMVLVGPSGCGKSTALRLLAGLEQPTAGTIRIGGRVVNHLAPRERDVAMVFQSYALYPHMNVFDNIAFGLRMRGMSRKETERQVIDGSRVLELTSLLGRKPRQLSGGQRQRVAVGRAIVRQPEVFLLDEPLSNLDARLRLQTRIELQRQHRALEATFVYVTHDQVEAMTMGDRIAVMKDGVLQQVAPPREIYEKPVNMYVAGFIGSPPMNLIPVVIKEGTTAVASGFEVTLPKPVSAKTAVIGIRPEDLTERTSDGEYVTRSGKTADGGTIDMKVEVVEVLGADQYVYGRSGTDLVTARVDPRLAVWIGDLVRLGVSKDRVHVFDVQTEESLQG